MERNLAVLIDFENIATGCDKEGLGRFDVRIVMRRLKDKGRILVARSYADWGRWNRFKLDLVHEGIQMVELTSHGMQSKNRADIALAVDAMELAYTRSYVDTFVILSGDSDFTPLVMRLKELNKRVIGCGTRRSTSRLIAETCDEFFFYDTLRDESRTVPAKKPAVVEEGEEEEPLTLDEAFELLVETLENLQRDEPGAVHASVLKASMKRKEPTFSEVELGVRTFAQFLETAQQKGLVRLIRDEKAGGFRVDLPHSTAEEPPPPPREPVRALSPEARRLQGLLAEAGLEIGEPRERRIIVEQFVGVCAERARRNRTCAVQFVLGDLLRRVKQEAPDIAPRTVKAVTHALRRAGLLIHPNGDAALSTTAPFVAPESAPQLLDELHAAGLRALEARGENPDDAVLTELFVGGEELPLPEHDDSRQGREGRAEGEREGRGRRGRRGGRGRRGTDGEGAPASPSGEPATEPATGRADTPQEAETRPTEPVPAVEAADHAPVPAGAHETAPAAVVEPAGATAAETTVPAKVAEPTEAVEPAVTDAADAAEPATKRPRRGRRKKSAEETETVAESGAEATAAAPSTAPVTPSATPAATPAVTTPLAEALPPTPEEQEAPATDGEEADESGASPERKRRRRGGRRGRRSNGAESE